MEIKVITPSSRPTYVGKGRITKVLLEPKDGIDSFSCTHVVFPPGEESEKHGKRETAEVVYVVDGVLTLIEDNTAHEVPKGGFAVIPRGTKHIHANRTDNNLEILVFLVPAGPEQVFLERKLLASVEHDADRIP